MIKNFYTRILAGYLLASFLVAANLMGACASNCIPAFANCLPITADYVIVGLGTAGAATARYLSDPDGPGLGASVIVLEAGENHTADAAVTAGGPFNGFSPAGYLPLYTKTYSTNYDVTQAKIFTGPQQSFYGEGRMWGGSSAHNYFFTVRGSPYFYNTVATQVANSQWNYANLEPYMIGMEDFIPNGITPTSNRGTTGSLIISQENPLPTTSNFLNAFATAANCPIVPDYNDPTYGNGAIGLSAQQIFSTLPTGGTRTYSMPAFLPDTVVSYTTGLGLNGRALRIISTAYATRILFEIVAGGEPQAVGVEYILNNNPNEVLQVFANKAVILCGGSIQDPTLLQRSGIGDPAILNPLGIPVVVNQPLVGTNLRNQYGPAALLPIDIADTFPQFIPAEVGFVDLSGTTLNVRQYANPYYTANSGIRRNEMLIQRDPFSFPNPGILDVVSTITPITDSNCVTVLTTILDPKSTGTVKIVSTDPLIDPQIDFNLYSDGPITQNGSDLNMAAAALQVLANVAVEDGSNGGNMFYPLTEFYPPPYGTGPVDGSGLESPIRNAYVVMNHPCGTCQMSPNISTGVVNSTDLSVWGVANGSLRVASNSVWPQTLDGNTSYFAYLIGLKMAKLLGATTVPLG